MLKEALEDALARGEKLRHDITKEIFSSQALSDLANNPRFVNTVALVIRSKEEVARTLQKRIKEIMDVMSIPTRAQVSGYAKRVARLERELDNVTRKMKGHAATKATAKTAKKSSKLRTTKKPKAARKKASTTSKKIAK